MVEGISKLLAAVGKRVIDWDDCGDHIKIEARSRVRAAPCPDCRCWSNRIHGRYIRRIAERPSLEQQVTLMVTVHRFKCPNPRCARHTFAEDIRALAGRHQRRTQSHARALRALGHALGGEAAARLGAELGLHASADTVLRQLRSAHTGVKHAPRVIGVDDWAIARGHHYGTIIVDLERREPIAVFAGREAMVVADWLREHPTIQIVARDRAGAYSEAVEMALPAAKQVSDRWHLLGNLRESVERLLHRLGPQLRQAAQQVEVHGVQLGQQGLPPGWGLRNWQRLSDDRRAARVARYQKVVALHAQGYSTQGIARELSLDHRTVRKFIEAGAFPERAPRARGATPLDRHREYLEQRIAQGCHCPKILWKEVRARGYAGSRSTMRDTVARLLAPAGRQPIASPSRRTMACPSPRRVFGWLAGWRKLNPAEPKSGDHDRFIETLCKLEPSVGVARSVTREFLGLLHRRRPREFDRWLKRVELCHIPELERFAAGLRADLSAVRAAFTLRWSNGQTEGHVNRLKFLKRQMYGRASVDLLRLRVLGPN